MAYRTTRIAVGVFYTLPPLRRALHDLEAMGIDRSDVNMATERRAVGARFGGRITTGTPAGPAMGGLRRVRVSWPEADGTGSIREWSRFIEIDDDPAGPLLISDGPRTTTLLGQDIDGATSRRDAEFRLGLPVEAIERGAVVVLVGVADSAEEKRVCTTLLRHAEDSVRVHDLGHD